MDANNLARECHCRLCEASSVAGETLDAGDLKLLADVGEHGWHVVLIPDDPVSRGWAFTVGVWHTLGSPELAVFGLDIEDAHSVLNVIGDAIRAGRQVVPDVEMDDVLQEGRLVTFRAVHESWYGPMFGYATWFARRPSIPIYQVVWSDSDGRWPWTPEIDLEYRVAQPRMWIPASSHPQGSWSGTLAPHPWPFEDVPDTAAFTTRRIAFDGADILGVSHDEDGSWQFLDGGSTTDKDIALVHLAHLVGAHTDAAELADLPLGWQAWRSDTRSAWVRSRSEEVD